MENMEEDMWQNPALTREKSENGLRDGHGQGDIITVVLTADNRLGHAAYSFTQNPHKREEGRQRLRRAFQQVTDFAVGQGVDLFVQAGNLFDSTNPDEEDRSFVAERLAQLRQAGVRTFALGGVLDTPATVPVSQDAGNYATHALPPQISYARLGALHYLPPAGSVPPANGRAGEPGTRGVYLEPVMVNVRDTLVGICGLGIQADQDGDPLAHMNVDSDIERASIPLLVLHAPLEAILTRSSSERAGVELSPPAPIDRSHAAQVTNASIANQAAFKYILAGYHQSYQQIHIGQTGVIVAGATQRVDFNDPDDEPGFVFLGIAADGIRWCHHIPVETLKLRRLRITMPELCAEGSDSEESPVTERILQRLEPLCTSEALVQILLTGEVTRSQYHQLNLSQVRRSAEERCFALAIDESGLVFAGDDSSVVSDIAGSRPFEERISVREELTTLADEWIAAAQDEQERQALQITKEEVLFQFHFQSHFQSQPGSVAAAS